MRIMLAVAGALALSVSPMPAAAAEVVLSLSNGVYYLRLESNASGVTVRRLKVVEVGQPETDPVVPTDPPDDPGLQGTAKIAFTEAIKVRKPSEAVALAAVYGAVAAELRSGSLDASEAADRTTEAVDTVLGVLGAKDRWSQWRGTIVSHLRTLGIRTGSDLATAYEDLEEGLTAAASGSQAALDLRLIIKLVMAILSKDPSAIVAAVLELIQSRQ